MKIAAHTLGCKLNYAETSDLLRRFSTLGHTIVDFHQAADLYIINTCTVTAVAEKKCRTAIRQAHRLNPEAQVAVIGCFAQVAAKEIEAIPGVTLVLGNDRKHLLPQLIGTLPACGGNHENHGNQPSDDLSNSDGQILEIKNNSDSKKISKICTAPDGQQTDTANKNDFQDFQDLAQRENGWEMTNFPLQYSSVGGSARTRTFFKIQDGCDYFCTYCAIPFARGRSRSATIEETLCMARRIADEGAKEVVLTGVNTGTFGQMDRRHPAGTTPSEPFLDLLRGLDRIDGILRYRISSIEPNLLTDDILRFVASSRAFLPHFHIPLQAGSDHVLALMHRRYDTALYRAKLERIKELMPDACIAADIMAGFNGENEEEFRKTLDFVESLPISYLHVFTYSDRPGTAALRLGEKIPIPVRHEHTARLLELSERKHQAFIQSQLGKTRPVLWESKKIENSKLKIENNRRQPVETKFSIFNFQFVMEGWTDNYIRLCRPYDPALVNTVTLETITPDNLVRDAAE